MSKTVVFFLQGGIGKHIAATAVAENISKNFPDRKLVVICPYPEVFLNNPNVYRIYRSNSAQYFYEDFIKDKDVIFLGNEVYQSHQYVVQKKHLIESWCNMFGLQYAGENPKLFLNFAEVMDVARKYNRNKPLLLLQTNGGGNEGHIYNWARDLPEFLVKNLIEKLKDKYHIYHIARNDQTSFENTEKISTHFRELFGLISLSQKRLFIDSFAQHAAASLLLPSTVCWIGTSPDILGYNIHNNIVAKDQSKIFTHNIDGIVMEKEFAGLPHQCEYNILEAFNTEEILSTLL
jgi:hypothetical protein